jgi:cytochrome c biogenesis factor
MYHLVLGLHNLVRWLVLAAGLWAVFTAWRAWLGRLPGTGREMRVARMYVGMLDLQFLLGVLLYAFFSPLTHDAFGNVGAAMHDPSARYFLLEHPLVMLVSIALAHVGVARARKAATDAGRFQALSVWLGVSLAAIAGFIPWARPLIPSF